MSTIVASEVMKSALANAKLSGGKISHWVINGAGELAISADPNFDHPANVATISRTFFGYPIAFDPYDNSHDPRIELVFGE